MKIVVLVLGLMFLALFTDGTIDQKDIVDGAVKSAEISERTFDGINTR